MRYICLYVFVFIAFVAQAKSLSFAQQFPHSHGHNDYRGWASQKTPNCCNNQDCRFIEDHEWREDANGIFVQIKGEWCPVLQEHFVVRGKSPDWTKAHYCINDRAAQMSPCERLLCFMGVPKH